MYKSMEVVTRRLFPLWPQFRLNHTSNFTSKSNSALSSPQINSVTVDQRLLHILEACKLSPNFRSAVFLHCKIIKHGYGMYPSLLSQLVTIYISCEKLNLARQLLSEMSSFNFGVVFANLLIDNFMKAGKVDIGTKLFSALPSPDVVTWNSMIGGCVRNGLFLESIGMFKEMLGTNIKPDGFTFAFVITASSRLGALNHGKWVHGLMKDKNIELNYILSSALVDMYSRCGRIETAKSIFKSSQKTHVSIWNSMINGLAIHGLAYDAISIFSNMESEKISPDPVSFIAILTACSHCGFVEQGRQYFDSMQKDYSITPQLEHYGTMVDLYARAGLLAEAYAMINKMPMNPDVVIWRTLLSACRTHKNSELAEIAITKIRHLGSGDYVLLSNIYCSVNKWDTAEKVRCTMNKKGVRRSSGKSWVELHDSVHHFRAGDRAHPDSEAIYKVLAALIYRTKMQGYVYTPDLVLMDISEEEKEENLSYHSEKLALAFGILKSSPGTEIRISKNLRTCLDCHSWMKIVSDVLHRVVIVRDRIRFHRYEKGSCSCGDYW